MKNDVTPEERVRQLLEQDKRYAREAYEFISDALTHTVSKRPRRRHVTGAELSDGIREYALAQFGPLARQVLRNWGVTSTSDFGEIVYNLIAADVMGKSEGDRREHFDNVYAFETAFEDGFEIDIVEKDLEL